MVRYSSGVLGHCIASLVFLDDLIYLHSDENELL